MVKRPKRDVRELFENWNADPAFQAEYAALEEEYALAAAVIEARVRAGLTQAELAARMGTSQSAIARLEGGAKPSLRTLEKLAQATGARLRIRFEPAAP